jgi:hypothetical protein
MVAQAEVIVNLAEDQQAVVDWGGVEVRDARAYTPQTVTVMNLEDAIAVAKAVLAFVGEDYADEILAEAQGEDAEILWDDGATPEEVGELDWEAYCVYREAQLEAQADAQADALSADWGHD